ncbi:SAM-dependent methyltransferase [Shewanella sp. D64]|uniref:SAM-dependent methyltransferase n=1 Tax=unclassified Shewanella TaxID=196818 RepID=UPI0022BA4758|nr:MULTISPECIES: SAM-dependent methyltransferase [unclassified Shewanella]MEC4726663.1 SAM-dependent methyltransferase [Shewanella sp. D64]MEC4738973.1 SAM-dependent methyltransferase [Shewanella sp. E94]WBJ96878.1 SAM-dependent methyltransferase [Shewanella sp. MTB7]
MKSLYLCPKCEQPLLIHETSQGLHCCKKHHFDKNENGYWIFSQAKKPQIDSRQIMRAKRFLLESGIFQPVVDVIETMIQQAEFAEGPINYLDYECGEGYYLRTIKDKLTQSPKGEELTQRLNAYGITEAENAIFSAAKIQSEANAEAQAQDETVDTEATDSHFIVSTLKKLPFASESFDLITLIDKQLKGKELIRLLKTGGYLIQVSPAPRHLWQIKSMVYPELTEKELALPKSSELELLHTEQVSFTLSIDGTQALALLEMTPYAWRANEKVRKQLAASSFDHLEIDFLISLSKKI